MQDLKDVKLVLEENFPETVRESKTNESVFITVKSINTDQLLELHWLIKDGRTDINLKRSGAGIAIQFTQKK